MSTDLYGVRVLDIDPNERQVRLRVVVVYYEVDEKAGPVSRGVQPDQPLPRDASFFFSTLWQAAFELGGGPICDEVTDDQWASELWVGDNCARFIDRVEQLQIRNDPPVRWLWPARGYPAHRSGDGTASEYEELGTYADYDVWVTDPRWLSHLSAGHAWRTVSYDIRARGYTSSLWASARTVRANSREPWLPLAAHRQARPLPVDARHTPSAG